MTKDLSKNVQDLFTLIYGRKKIPIGDNVDETVKKLFLLDDILKMKGHPRSVNLKDENPYEQDERHSMILELMNLDLYEKFKFRGITRMWRGIMLEHAGFIKPGLSGADLTEKRYRRYSKLYHANRYERFVKKLQQLIEPATHSSIDIKVRYDNLIPKPELFKGKGRLVGKSIWAKRPILWNLISTELYSTTRCLGEVSQKALKVINSLNLSMDYEFEVVEEWEKIPTRFGWKNSDVKRKVKVVLEYCRY